MNALPAMVQVDVWTLVVWIVGQFVVFMGCIFGFAKVIGRQAEKRLDEKFKAQDVLREEGAKLLRADITRYTTDINRYTEQAGKTADQVANLERDFLNWRAELPLHYVRREDYVRGQSVIEAKLDALYNKLEVVQMRGVKND